MFTHEMLELADHDALYGVHVVDGWDYADGDGPVNHIVTAEPLVPWPADPSLTRRPPHVLPTIIGRYKATRRLSSGGAVYGHIYVDLTAKLPTIGANRSTIDHPFG